MTCIVGLIDEKSNNVVIGGDSAAVAGHDVSIVSHPKVFKNGDFVFGCTTSFRMMQLIQFKFIPPMYNNRVGFNWGVENSTGIDEELLKYMATLFVDELRKCMEAGGFLYVENKQESGGQFLVGYKNRLFKINSDFSVLEYSDGYCAAGVGENYALGALKILDQHCKKMSSKDKVTIALESAAYFSGGVLGPFVVVSST